jgi:hypothetical protein
MITLQVVIILLVYVLGIVMSYRIGYRDRYLRGSQEELEKEIAEWQGQFADLVAVNDFRKAEIDRLQQSYIDQSQLHLADEQSIRNMAKEISRLLAICKEIEEHGPGCHHRLASDNFDYDRGIKQGHDCTSAIAAKAREK